MGAGAAAGAPYGGGSAGGIGSLLAQALRGQQGPQSMGGGGGGKSGGPPSPYQPQQPQGPMAPGYAAAQQLQRSPMGPQSMGGAMGGQGLGKLGKSTGPGAPYGGGFGGGPTAPSGQGPGGFTQSTNVGGMSGMYRPPGEQVQGPNNPVMQAKAGNAQAAAMNQANSQANQQAHADDPWYNQRTSTEGERQAAGQSYAYQGPVGYGNKGASGVQPVNGMAGGGGPGYLSGIAARLGQSLPKTLPGAPSPAPGGGNLWAGVQNSAY